MSYLRKRLKEQSGVIAIIIALLLPVLVGILGIIIDLGFAYQYKRLMQTAADAGAMAGAHWLYRGEVGSLNNEVLYDTGRNGFDGSHGETRTINRPPTSGDFAGKDSFVEVIISQQLPTYFMPVLGINDMTVAARAVAGVGGSQGCVYVLDGTEDKALEVSSGSTLSALGCKIKVSSCSSEAMSTTSGSSATADDIDVCGDYDCSGSTCEPTPDTGECDGNPCAKGEDPLATVPDPVVPGGCVHTEYKVSSVGTQSNRFQIYGDQTYCGGLWVESGSHVNFNPGTYWIIGGGFNIGSGSTATGDGITIYNSEGAGYSYEPIGIQSGSHVEFTAQQGDSAGVFDRILFWQDRSITGDYDNKIESNTGSFFEGLLYFRDQHLMFHSNTTGESSAGYSVVVANTLEVSSGTTLNLSAGGSGDEGLPEPTLVE